MRRQDTQMRLVYTSATERKVYRNVLCAAAKWVHAVLSMRRARQPNKTVRPTLRRTRTDTLRDSRTVDVLAEERGALQHRIPSLYGDLGGSIGLV